MEDRVLELIKSEHFTYDEIISFFGLEKSVINSVLFSLEKKGLIDKVKDRYYLTSELNLIPARIVSIKEKFAFASVSEDEDVYIAIQNLKNAFLDDTVLIRKISNHYEKEEFEVVKITCRARETVVGQVKFIKGSKILIVDRLAPSGYLFLIEDSDLVVTNGQVVEARFKKISSKSAVVEVVKIIGDINDIGVDVSRIILFNNAPLYFPKEVIEEVKRIPSEVSENEKVGREDFTDHLIVTIDGEDAKDFDDAVEVIKVDDIYYVGVHIADVSHYVKENSYLDKEALNRATSLYVQDRVVPMIPFELSNGICSLNPNVERLVTSCLFAINDKGKILSSEICKSVIKSKYRLTYSYVNKFLKEERFSKAKYTPLEKMLIELQEVSDLIRKKRKKKGSLELTSTELEFSLDEEGTPYKISKRHQDVAERLIEDLMIKANEIVASSIEKMELPMVYRIHEKPKAKKLESYQNISLSKGYPFAIDVLDCTPLDISNYLKSINESDRKVLSSLLLRCLAKAKYSIQNKKHFGLASDSYTHFTSPIRRYPDLMVHRLIEKYIVNNKKVFSSEDKALLDMKCQLCSNRERRSLVIERAVEALLCSKYMANHLGEEYSAVIVSMTTQGMFVEIENGIQGFVSFESISGDYYIFDEVSYRSYGVRKGREFLLGDNVRVICSNVDLTKNQITFALISKLKINKISNGKNKNEKRRK